eukprot:TRINITY_DN2437_c0_g1_i4.p1 TRINITY_DN2437_c0_g1~~TRINITY_DN2437_c0_g1_i4.p1  ORF type:complete len:164 (-),score=60.07 TRINITY_DN2437_c0_g1_i4:356-805(-)
MALQKNEENEQTTNIQFGVEYSRQDLNCEDLWDDTELIQAYDAAVENFKKSKERYKQTPIQTSIQISQSSENTQENINLNSEITQSDEQQYYDQQQQQQYNEQQQYYSQSNQFTNNENTQGFYVMVCILIIRNIILNFTLFILSHQIIK